MKKIILITAVYALCANAHSQSWNLTGNAGTSSTTNFIGTTDNKAFKIRTNNSVRITVASSGKVGIGTASPVFKLDVKGGSINTDSVYRIGGKTILSINGSQNLFVGSNSGAANTTGSINTAIGSGAFYSNTEGFDNTAIGADALFTNISGNWNTAIGSGALYYNTTGNANSAIGLQALFANTEGFGNAALGYAALHDNTIGEDNTATGSYSLTNNTEGYSNTASGNYALHFNTNGNNNTAVGDNANTSLGTLDYASVIGSAAVVNANDKVRIGDAGITVIEGQVAYSFPSDGRFKENVKDDVKGLDFILKLQPVSYNFNRLKFAQHVRQHLTPNREKTLVEQSQNRSVGFIAQDVERVIQQTGFSSFDAVHSPTNETDNYSMAYAEFVVPLVKAIQELNEMNLKSEIRSLKLEEEIESLKSEIRNQKSNQSVISNPKTALLFQNSPNPFNQTTVIRYALSAEQNNGVIIIRDLSGNLVKSVSVSNTGKGQVIINANEFTQGTYTYSLEVAGESVDTKLMVITK